MIFTPLDLCRTKWSRKMIKNVGFLKLANRPCGGSLVNLMDRSKRPMGIPGLTWLRWLGMTGGWRLIGWLLLVGWCFDMLKKCSHCFFELSNFNCRSFWVLSMFSCPGGLTENHWVTASVWLREAQQHIASMRPWGSRRRIGREEEPEVGIAVPGEKHPWSFHLMSEMQTKKSLLKVI